eukprot:CAMPEP_0113870168 /NCGR_PEP_ID=MMETSP0780_2-20120614/1938_1 /TAXON_ID=652834 /ORGANISM="Palpitomonas bilix" /LENGTH=331 /DNA_ID=CAMNT_0000855419 /DNA_START=174 /DNA_END=1169 /DNA_ORIENTATION=+ /assembly_acc=CAM_ASM_000599
MNVADSSVKSVVVHPLVLLSVVDHYNRVALSTRKRVVGVLLGEIYKGKCDVKNSFAVPFDEDERDPTVWFLDHLYLENMFAMFKKVTARERIVGWYSTGPKIRSNDLMIHELFKRYTKSPIYTILRVTTEEQEIPSEAYISVDEVKDNGTKIEHTFRNVPSEIGAIEAEEIGVEHLLRDVKDQNVSTLAEKVQARAVGLGALKSRLKDIRDYLEEVATGKRSINHEITDNLQNIFNLLPNLNVEDMIRAFAVKTNDMMVILYISSLIRSIIALHDLINNKADFIDQLKKEQEEKLKKKEELAKKKKEEEDKKKEAEEKSTEKSSEMEGTSN